MAADTAKLRRDLMDREGIKTAAVSNRMNAVQKRRTMTQEDALYVIAAQAGLKISKYGLDPETLTRVADHLAILTGYDGPTKKTVAPSKSGQTAVAPDTRATRFDARNFHEIVVKRSRKAFTTGQYHDAVLRAFRSVNNRVKQVSGSSKDGQPLMSAAFRADAPLLQMSDLTTESLENEQAGTMLMMMGAITAMRNPRAHEDEWPRDEDEAYVLDALAFASLLHRLIDLAEGYAST